jgi:hypothetical protein
MNSLISKSVREKLLSSQSFELRQHFDPNMKTNNIVFKIVRFFQQYKWHFNCLRKVLEVGGCLSLLNKTYPTCWLNSPFSIYWNSNFNPRLPRWRWNKRTYTETQGNTKIFLWCSASQPGSKWSRIFNISKVAGYWKLFQQGSALGEIWIEKCLFMTEIEKNLLEYRWIITKLRQIKHIFMPCQKMMTL